MIIHNDALVTLKDITSETIDLVVTDPPYGIEFMGKDWDKALPSTDIWKQCYRVLKEGKLAFIMCSPRQDVLSRMILSLDMAGFKTGYTSIYWTYASGFPKAANVSKLIDKKAGAKREILGYKSIAYPDSNCWGIPNRNITAGGIGHNDRVYGNDIKGYENTKNPITKPATEEAKKMEGAYVGFQPKPAVEIILVVSKGKTLTWLDDCRIPYQSEDTPSFSKNASDLCGDGGWNKKPEPFANQKGRFPANLLVSDDVLNDGKITRNHKRSNVGSYLKGVNDGSGSIYGEYSGRTRQDDPQDEGSYSRYFDLDKWYQDRFPFIITPKASKSERNEGCEDLPLNLKNWHNHEGRDPNNPKNFIHGKNKTFMQNNHPTVKPIKLMSYLIILGSRENDLVLDPFCGSGTTLIAAEQLRRKWLGIEINADYIQITKERLLEETNQWKMDMFVENK